MILKRPSPQLERPTTLLDREKKQVEFVKAADVKSRTLYVYDEWPWDPIDGIPASPHLEPEYGTHVSKKVWVIREFTNSVANHLGLPLPKGRVRVYRRNSDGQMEFTGENTIKHTPRGELVRIFTGNAFDLVGERKRTEFKESISGPAAVDPNTGLPLERPGPGGPPTMDESFEIHLRNRKGGAVEIRVVEHLYRWVNWQITARSDPFTKTDAQTIEFRLPLEPDAERTITYTVHYWW